MLSRRWRPVVLAVAAVVAVWAAALLGYRYAQGSRVTADKLRAYTVSLDLAKLTPEQRVDAIQKLAAMLNALPFEERQRARLEHLLRDCFEQMTEQEKAGFIEATMPTGFKQMLNAFEQLPEDKRRKAIDDALRRLRAAQSGVASGEGVPEGTNGPPVLSPELEARVRTIGLKAFYSQSSAQTKAELAPVLEELQRVMESGRPFHGR